MTTPADTPFRSATDLAAAGLVALDLVPDREFMALPKGVSLQVIDNAVLSDIGAFADRRTTVSRNASRGSRATIAPPTPPCPRPSTSSPRR